MKTEHKQNTEWKQEIQRREREERIAASRLANGEKKPISVGPSKGRRLLFPILSAVLILAILLWGSFSLGLIQRLVSPMTVGTEKVSVVEYQYSYNNLYLQYNQYAQQGVMPTNSKGSLDMNALTGFGDYANLTWGEFLDRATQEQLQRLTILSKLAKDAGMTLTEDNEKFIQQQIDNAIKNFGSRTAAENSLVKAYGRGITLDDFQAILTKMYLADQYISEMPKDFPVSEEEAEAYYKEHVDDFDVVDFYSFNLNIPALSDADKDKTEAEKKELTDSLKKQVEEVANAFADAVRGKPDQFKTEVEIYKSNSTFSSDERSEFVAIPYANLQNSTIGDWIKEEGTNLKKGDVKVVSTSSSVQVVMFLNRYRPEEHRSTLGKLQLRLGALPTEDQAAAEVAKAQALAALVEKLKSVESEVTDKATLDATSQKLQSQGEITKVDWLEQVNTSSLTVEEATWVNSSDRKKGDVGIFQTSNGAELLLFDERSEDPAWLAAVRQVIQNEKVTAKIEELSKAEEYAISISKIGMYFVDKLDKNTKTGEEVLKEQEAAKAEESKTASEAQTTEASSQAENPAATTAEGSQPQASTLTSTTAASATSQPAESTETAAKTENSKVETQPTVTTPAAER